MGCWKAVDKETLLVVLSCSDPKFLIVVTSEDYDELNESLSLASDKPSTICFHPQRRRLSHLGSRVNRDDSWPLH